MSNCFNEAIRLKTERENAKYVYVSFSGGKDSTAMLLRMLELGEQVDEIVFADTGFEYQELYDYIDLIEKYIGRPITRLKFSKEDFNKWFYGTLTRGDNKGDNRGFPTAFIPCWLTREAKIKQLEDKMVDAKNICVGIAYDEQKRIGNKEFIRYPLNEWKWTEQDCVRYLNKLNIINPLYKNFNRIGCYFCPKQSPSSLYTTWKVHPELWKKFEYYSQENVKLMGVEITIAVSKKISHHSKDLRMPLSWFTNKFESGWIPEKLPQYACTSDGCTGVKDAFANIPQKKLDRYVQLRKSGELESK